MNGGLLRAHGAHGELWTHSTDGELVRAHNVSVNHSADAHRELSMASNVSCEDLAMCGELLVAHNSGGESHGELFMARDACRSEEHTSDSSHDVISRMPSSA